MKHTKGEWIVKEWDQTGTDFYHIRSKNKFTDLIATIFRWKGHIDKREAQANAKLIAEAGTVTNETGYTPRQLAEQKAELLELSIMLQSRLEQLIMITPTGESRNAMTEDNINALIEI